MLSPLALKLSVPNTVVKAASAPHSGTKPGIQNDLSSASGQFGEELAAVIKEASGKADAQGPTITLPGPVAQGIVKQSETFATGQTQTQSVVAAPVIPVVSTPLPMALPPVIPTPENTVSLGIPSGSESTKTVSGDKTTKKEDRKEDEQTGLQPFESAPAVPIQTLTAQAIPVPVSLPPIPSPTEDNQRTTVKDGDALRPVISSAPLPRSVSASIPVPKDLPVEPSATIPAPAPVETEAFSLRLQPKTDAAPTSAVPSDALRQEASGQNKLGKSGPIAQVGKPDQIKNAPATNSASTAPSTLGQSVSVAKVSGANRDTEQRDRENLPSAKLTSGDARESKQSVADIASTVTAPAPTSFVKETKSAGEVRDVPSIDQPISVENHPAGAAKEVAIRLQNQSGETINVKLIDQGGQVQVTVRSSDPEAASALRQDLSSLTSSLDKAGWRPEVPLAMNGGSFEPVHQTRQTDRDSQDTPSQRQAEWQQETPRKRHSVADTWDEILTNQTV